MNPFGAWRQIGSSRDLARVVRLLLPYVRRHRRTLVIALFASLGFVVAEVLKPWPIKVVLDILTNKHHKLRLPFTLPEMLRGEDKVPLLLTASAVLVVLAALGGLCGYARTILLATAAQKIMARLRQDVHDRLLSLSLRYHDQNSSGDLLVRLTGDVAAMKDFLVEGLVEVVQQSLMIVAMLAAMLLISPRLTLFTAIILPLLAFVLSHFAARIRQTARKQRKKEGQIAAAAYESLASVAVIQAYGLEPIAQQRFGYQNRKSTKAGLAATRLENSMTRMTETVIAVSVAVLLYLGSRAVAAETMTPGDLVLFVAYVRSLYKPLRVLMARGAKLAKASACGERIVEVLSTQPEISSPPAARATPRLLGEISFEHVGFAYGELQVLHDVDLRIAPGRVIGLVGENGAGKSTLTSLVPRLRDVTAGRVLIDGQDVRELELGSLRKQIGFVFQKALLFDGTIAENIRLGNPEASAEQVEDAAEHSGVIEFASRLPDGLQTRVGEGGEKLSGGQRQRVALARALVRDPAILILDEPATALDPKAEKLITEHLMQNLRGKTVIMITHRLAALEQVDEVIVLERGRVVQRGSLAKLRAHAGPFADFLQQHDVNPVLGGAS
ncbi:MAG: ABC transporter ATP-binding protein [Planctomycetota bacterium]